MTGDMDMEQGGLNLTSWSSLLDVDTKPWVGSLLSSDNNGGGAGVGDKRPWVGVGGVVGDTCVVCGDRASGRHYGAISCEGCKGFFKRSIRKQLGYSCRGSKQCEVTKHHRNRCQYCRLQKCLQMGMRSDSVQHERKPLSNNQGHHQKRSESTDVALSPSSIFGSLLDNNSFNSSRSGLQLYDSMYQEEDESSANESDVEKTSIAKAIELISSVITEQKDEESSSSSSVLSIVDKEPVVPDDWLKFPLKGPNPLPANGVVNMGYVSESATRLLFLSIYWSRTLPAFRALSCEVQILLMKSAWSELFILGLCQRQNILPLTSVINALLQNVQSQCTSSKLTSLAECATRLKTVIKAAENLNLTEPEYAFLKAVALFTPGVYPHYDSTSNSIIQLQKNVCNQLEDYIIEKLEVENPSKRLGLVFLFLHQLRSITPATLEEVFLSTVMGPTPIENLVPYIMKVRADLSVPDETSKEQYPPYRLPNGDLVIDADMGSNEEVDD